ncbi:GNAT family N-acetyltransferase [Streptomyces sp. AV19]|nr:GNAT family N-acetyltransferase [Streptomyces sp. AV19]
MEWCAAVPAAGPWASWFPAGRPGPGALAEHVRTTGHGRWWVDRPADPRAAVVTCARHAVLSGDPRTTAPAGLAGLAHHYVLAPDRFLPVLGAAFERLVPWERMIWIHHDPGRAAPPRPAPGIRIRRLIPTDAPAVRGLGEELSWITESWGGPAGLAAPGRAWGAFRGRRLLSLAAVHFTGSRYEDLAAATRPGERGRGLATACVTALCADVASRGRVPSWTCSRDNHPSRGLAAAAGFRPEWGYVHYAVGAAAVRGSVPVR